MSGPGYHQESKYSFFASLSYIVYMNFLAHLCLSGDSPPVLFGNFITDFLNGIDAKSYQKEIYLGILLHRKIDAFTDKHRQVAESKKRLWQRHRHYSSVIVDIFYDHFLAKNWHEYNTTTLEDFARNAYTTIQQFDTLLPPKAKQVLPRMIVGNWLISYRELSGINRVMQGMAGRASFPTEMAGAIRDLKKEYTSFENDFKIFFPQLKAHTRIILQSL